MTADELGGQAASAFAVNALAEIAEASSLAGAPPVVANSFLPTPLGWGSALIDSDSDLVTLSTPRSSLATNATFDRVVNASGTRSYFQAGDFADRDTAFASDRLADSQLPIPLGGTVWSAEDLFDQFVNAFDGDDTERSVVPSAIESDVTPAAEAGFGAAAASETPTQGGTEVRTQDASYYEIGGVVGPSPIIVTTLPEQGTDRPSTTGVEALLTLPATGIATTVPLSEPTTGSKEADDQRTVVGSSSDSDSFVTESDGKAEEPIAAREDRSITVTTVMAPRDGAVGRVAMRPAPPAGTDDLGAGAIDLTDLLFAGDVADATLVAGTTVPNTASEDAARDAALAIESWVRAIPAPAAAGTNGFLPRDAQAEESAVGTTLPLQQPAGSVTISIDGDRLSAVAAPSGPELSIEGENPETGTSAAVRLERPNAYRYAISAVSVLLGGVVLYVARWRGSDADIDRKPGAAGRPRPGEAGSDFRPDCE